MICEWVFYELYSLSGCVSVCECGMWLSEVNGEAFFFMPNKTACVKAAFLSLWCCCLRLALSFMEGGDGDSGGPGIDSEVHTHTNTHSAYSFCFEHHWQSRTLTMTRNKTDRFVKIQHSPALCSAQEPWKPLTGSTSVPVAAASLTSPVMRSSHTQKRHGARACRCARAGVCATKGSTGCCSPEEYWLEAGLSHTCGIRLYVLSYHPDWCIREQLSSLNYTLSLLKAFRMFLCSGV